MADNINVKKIEESLNLVKSKESKIFVLTQDSKGNPKASIAYNYNLVKSLVNEGYNAFILHENNDYKLTDSQNGEWMSISEWLGEEYSSLPHACVSSGELSVGPSDVLIVPELFGHVMEQTKNMACTKVVLCQSYDYIFEMLQPGVQWLNYGYTHVITTSEISKEYILSIFPNMNITVIPPAISTVFNKSEKPGTPLVAIHTREPRDTMKIVKTFYARYPQFKWITFRDMRGMSMENFAETLQDVAVAVWVDDISGFGTFPLECMKSGVPVIGKIPNLKPEWLAEENGFWTYEFNQIVDVINAYMKTWLEDSVPSELFEKMDITVSDYTYENQDEKIKSFTEKLMEDKIEELENAINKLTVNEEN